MPKTKDRKRKKSGQKSAETSPQANPKRPARSENSFKLLDSDRGSTADDSAYYAAYIPRKREMTYTTVIRRHITHVNPGEGASILNISRVYNVTLCTFCILPSVYTSRQITSVYTSRLSVNTFTINSGRRARFLYLCDNKSI